MREVLKFAILLLLLMAGSGRIAAQDENPTIITLTDGHEISGVILQDDGKELVLRTWVGDKKVLWQNIKDLRRNLTADERTAILRRLNPGKDEQERLERDKQFAAHPVIDTPKVEAPPRREPERVFVVEDRGEARGSAPRFASINPASWQQRLSAGLDKKVSLDLVDGDYEEALELVSAVTGINLIINPKVREQKHKVTLSIKNMDAANALKWLSRLTDTYVELVDQALYVTDKPSKEEEDEERNDIVMQMASAGADMSLLPPAGNEITNEDRTKIAMAIWDKTNPKPKDFPGPDLTLVGDSPEPGAIGGPFAPGP